MYEGITEQKMQWFSDEYTCQEMSLVLKCWISEYIQLIEEDV